MGSSSALLDNKSFNKLLANRLEAQKIKVNEISELNEINENNKITPLVFFSIPSVNNSPITLELINEHSKTNQYRLIINKNILTTTVTKRVHEYSPINKTYWELLPDANTFLKEATEGYLTNGVNFDIDDIGGIFPGTFNNLNNLSVCHLLYLENNQSYQINFYIRNITENKSSYIFELYTDVDGETHPNISSHPEFEKQYHFHAFPTSNSKVIIPNKTITVNQWALELYQDE